MILEPTLLKDKKRLAEVYQLRTLAWENSEKKEFVNSILFPSGWQDPLDDTGKHIIITDMYDKIIAAARMNTFSSFEVFLYYNNIKHIDLHDLTPFCFYSRLVVQSEYRNTGLSLLIDKKIETSAAALKSKWILALTSDRTNLMINKLGYQQYGSAFIKYHNRTKEHLVDVLIKHL